MSFVRLFNAQGMIPVYRWTSYLAAKMFLSLVHQFDTLKFPDNYQIIQICLLSKTYFEDFLYLFELSAWHTNEGELRGGSRQ